MRQKNARAVSVAGPLHVVSNLQCPLWVNNGHRDKLKQCPLYPGQKRTLHQSFDHLVRSYLQRLWDCKPKSFGDFEVYNEFKLGRLHDRQIGRFFAPSVNHWHAIPGSQRADLIGIGKKRNIMGSGRLSVISAYGYARHERTSAPAQANAQLVAERRVEYAQHY